MGKTIQEMLAHQASQGNTQQPQYLDTVEAYDKWAEVYDTDGNFLQRLDTLQMRTLLPRFLDLVSSRFAEVADPLALVDLGCGTGRNTVLMLEALHASQTEGRDASSLQEVEIVGLDASPGMLDVARNAIQSARKGRGIDRDVSLGMFDLLRPTSTMAQLPSALKGPGASGVISTLVLEHIPLEKFFEAASSIMMPGAYFLVTNMHAEMGSRSQAGFTDPKTGVKIRPTSYCHSIPEVLAAAEKAGFQIEDLYGNKEDSAVVERDVDERLAEVLGERARKWIGVKVWFGVCFSKK
ncbi:hypothetical protein N7492_007016 [Penicillium capsulatum]|uniref:Methyltransferase domain-containing protein n=1 Tax=Penicillium capsulatum TaxID=69766 RepID=A0A9W9HZ04_9EURO|nr:hypothetical protein N7492_007016 [Penicillium capsulatum]KAJ6116849.1 hypothetical protein N7512_006574 [Penicillium capsulatum]